MASRRGEARCYEETIRQREILAEKKLQVELDKLMRKNNRCARGAVVMGAGFTLDPFDRAVFRAMLDVDEELGLNVCPASSVRPKVQTNSWPWQFVPLGGLVVALFLVPGQGWRAEPLRAEKLAKSTWSVGEVRMDVPSKDDCLPEKTEPTPRNTDRSARHRRPIQSAEDAALVKKHATTDAGSYVRN